MCGSPMGRPLEYRHHRYASSAVTRITARSSRRRLVRSRCRKTSARPLRSVVDPSRRAEAAALWCFSLTLPPGGSVVRSVTSHGIPTGITRESVLRPHPGDMSLRSKVSVVPGIVPGVARTKRPPISAEDRRVVGALLRDLRKGAGYRSVEAAAALTGAPASRQTIYAYERGGLTPSLAQFLDLVEFYVLRAPRADGAKPERDLRAQGIAAVTRVLDLPLYHVAAARELVSRMQPDGRRGR